jgi:Uma2 family endonuclease
VATTTSLTIDDFERLPADAVQNRELVDGELIDVSGNTPLHNIVRDELLSHLMVWAKAQSAGRVIAEQEYDFLGNAHGPDVSFFGREKQALLDNYKRVQRFVPDLAIEVASASDTYDSLLGKKNRYRRAGTTEVWLISAENAEIAIYGPDRDRILHAGHTLTSELLPDFALAVNELFRGLQT